MECTLLTSCYDGFYCTLSQQTTGALSEFRDRCDRPTHTTAAALHTAFSDAELAAALTAVVERYCAVVQAGTLLAAAAAACWEEIAALVEAALSCGPLARPASARADCEHPPAHSILVLCQLLCDKGADNIMLCTSRALGGNFTTALLLATVQREGKVLLGLNANAFICLQSKQGGCVNIADNSKLRAVSAVVQGIYLRLVLASGCRISGALQLTEFSTAELLAEGARQYPLMAPAVAAAAAVAQQLTWRRVPHPTLAQPTTDLHAAVAALVVKAILSAALGRLCTQEEYLQLRAYMITQQQQQAAEVWPTTDVGDAELPPAGFATQLTAEAAVALLAGASLSPEVARTVTRQLTSPTPAPAVAAAAEQSIQGAFSDLHSQYRDAHCLLPEGSLRHGVVLVGSFAPADQQPGQQRPAGFGKPGTKPVFMAAAAAPFVQAMSATTASDADTDYTSVAAVQLAHSCVLTFDAWSINDEAGGQQGGHLSPSKDARAAGLQVTVSVLSSEQFAAAAHTVIIASEGIAKELQPALLSLRDSGRAFDITAAVDALSRQLTGRQYSAHCAHGGVYLVLGPSGLSAYLLFLTMHLSAPLMANGNFAWEGLPAPVQFARAQGPLWVAVCLTRVLQGVAPLVFEKTACYTFPA
jgi:hypothetical protein